LIRCGELHLRERLARPRRPAGAGDEQQRHRELGDLDGCEQENRQREEQCAADQNPPARADARSCGERTDDGPGAVRREERTERARSAVQRVARQDGEQRSHRAESEEPEHDADAHDRQQQAGGPHMRDPFAQCTQTRLPPPAAQRIQLGGPHRDERCEDCEERPRVDDEAPARADGSDQDAAERRPDDLRRVLQADVERDRVRQILSADELVDERVLARVVEDERDSGACRQEVQEPQPVRACECDGRESRRDAHREGL